MKLIAKVLLLLSIVVFGNGCVSDEANRCYIANLPPKNVKDIEVFKKAPSQPYTVVADFQAVNATIQHMKKRAAEVGADAIIVVPLGGWYDNSEVWASKDRFSSNYSRLTATAIKFNK